MDTKLFRIITATFLCLILISCNKNESFSTEKWRNSSWNDRQNMVDSFLEEHFIKGMTKEEIISLLGYETSEDPLYSGLNIRLDSEDKLVYDFGLKKGGVAENIALVIQLDENDTAINYDIVTYSQ